MSEPMRYDVELLEEDRAAGKYEAMNTRYYYSKVEKLSAEKSSLLRQLEAALAANREKDAEIARIEAERSKLWTKNRELLGSHDVKSAALGDLRDELIAKEAELASLRASGGEKWIDVKQELPPNDSRIETIDMREPFPELTADHMGVNHSDLRRWEKIGTHFTHWRIVAPPALTREKE